MGVHPIVFICTRYMLKDVLLFERGKTDHMINGYFVFTISLRYLGINPFSDEDQEETDQEGFFN